MTATVDNAVADLQRANAELQRQLDECRAELAARNNSAYGERIEQQSAVIDVLKMMSASPGDPQPVFDLITRRAREFCNANAALYGFNGELIDLLSADTADNTPELLAAFRSQFPIAPTRGSAFGRAILDRQIVHIRDVDTDPEVAQFVRDLGVRSIVALPLLRGGTVIGVIALNAKEPGGLSDSQVALLKTFAEQVVIAISSAETHRALQERTGDLQESLEYQTATSDVLKVISRSTFDLQPVLDTLVETAARLCNSDSSGLSIREGDVFRYVATHSADPGFADLLRQRTFAPGRGTMVGRIALEGNVIHVADVAADPEYDLPEAVTLGKMRTMLGVPLLREGAVVGTLNFGRLRIEPFTERQIELVRTFADQAVIAIENTRLLTETQEALDQQTATAEILGVINSSPGDLAPVFEAMLDKALRLCGAALGELLTYDGEYIGHAACQGPPALVEYFRNRPPGRPAPGSTMDRLMQGEASAQVLDVMASDLYERGDPIRRALVDLGGCRSLASVAMRKDDALLGAIHIYRQEVRPFSEKEIALLQNFAAQAVIAMENARLLGELRERTGDLQESLEYQTATSDVLKVISRSTFDLQPVFETIVATAARLCDADSANITNRESAGYRMVATFSYAPEHAAVVRGRLFTVDRGSVAGRVALEGRIVQIDDIAADPEYTNSTGVTFGGRTVLGVPLLREGGVVGTINLARQRVQPFTERQIELVRTFADQAVIAIENARLLTETREALEQQQAMAEVLRVINSSPGELQPVFDILAEKATRLCDAAIGGVSTISPEGMVTHQSTCGPPALLEWARAYRPIAPAAPGTTKHRLIQGEEYAQVEDAAAEPLDNPGRRALVELGGGRTFIDVALRKDDKLLGAITVYRQEVRPFTAKEIALLKSFAAQAVIAMDNARLLDEIRQRQAELRVTFDNMGDGVAMFDAELRLAAWNRNFQELLDLPDDFFAGRPTSAEFVRHLATRGEFGAVDVEAEVRRLTESVATQWSAERTRPDGRVIEVRHNPVPGGGFVLIYSDVTERKRAEEAIRAARDAAEAALRELKTAQANLIQAEKMASLGQLTAGIAHEIKNPLNFVNNFAGLSVELLNELKAAAAPGIAELDEDTRADINETVEMLTGNLEKIAEHGRRADGIVKSMLEHSRGVSGERREVDLNGLIEEALNLAYHGARAQDQSFNITLEREFDRAVRPIEVAPQEITRAFLNLFGNGFYAANKRARGNGDAAFRPVLIVSTRDLGDAVEVKVRDNGTGIPSEIKDKLFQPFFTTKPTGEGTGLGLSISYDIVTQQHGGTIAVDSEVGEFTEFTIRLPRSFQATTGAAA